MRTSDLQIRSLVLSIQLSYARGSAEEGPGKARRLAEAPIMLEELSSEFDISRVRVRQIEVRAFEKVQAAVEEQ